VFFETSTLSIHPLPGFQAKAWLKSPVRPPTTPQGHCLRFSVSSINSRHVTNQSSRGSFIGRMELKMTRSFKSKVPLRGNVGSQRQLNHFHLTSTELNEQLQQLSGS
jgi:hypothetical protein